MKRLFLAIIILTAVFVVNFGLSRPLQAASDDFGVILEIFGCDNDGICESENNETADNCPNDCPPPTPTTTPATPGGGQPQLPPAEPPEISNVRISLLTPYSATINWQTDVAAVCSLSWGRTVDYQDGTSQDLSFLYQHQSELNELTPNQNYFFQITCRNQTGQEATLSGFNFLTAPLPDTTPPPAPAAEAFFDGQKIIIRWPQPAADYDQALIKRSESFYPDDKHPGIVYEGRGDPAGEGYYQFADSGVKINQYYYYAIWADDYAGNRSVPALIRIFTGVKPAEPEIVEPEIVEPEPPAASSLVAILQLEQPVDDFRDTFLVWGQLPFTVKWSPNSRVATSTTRAIIIINKNGQASAYGLNWDGSGEGLSALLPPLIGNGFYSFDLYLLNDQNQALEKRSGQLAVSEFNLKLDRLYFNFFGWRWDYYWLFCWLLIITDLLLLYWYWRWRRDRR